MLFVGKGTLICLLTVIFSDQQLRRKSESLCLVQLSPSLVFTSFCCSNDGFRLRGNSVRQWHLYHLCGLLPFEFVQNMSGFSRKFRESSRKSSRKTGCPEKGLPHVSLGSSQTERQVIVGTFREWIRNGAPGEKSVRGCKVEGGLTNAARTRIRNACRDKTMNFLGTDLVNRMGSGFALFQSQRPIL